MRPAAFSGGLHEGVDPMADKIAGRRAIAVADRHQQYLAAVDGGSTADRREVREEEVHSDFRRWLDHSPRPPAVFRRESDGGSRGRPDSLYPNSTRASMYSIASRTVRMSSTTICGISI